MKYNKFEKVKLHDLVKIHSNNPEWNNLNGIVDSINSEFKIAYIFSIVHPTYSYMIDEYNLGDIELIEK